MSTLKTAEAIQAQIDQVTAESVNFIGRIEKDLAAAKEQRLTEGYQLELETKIAQSKAAYGAILNRLDDDLSTAKETEIRDAAQKQEKQARAAAEVKEQIKAQ